MAQSIDSTSAQGGLTDQAAEKAQEAASVAQEKASDLREQGIERFRTEFDQRSNDAASQVRSVADALRRSRGELEQQGKSSAAQWVGQAADRVEGVAGYLERTSGDDVIHDIEGFARRRPWLLAGAGMLAGIAAARFVKASSEQRSSSRWQAQQPVRPALAPGDPVPDYAGVR